MACLVPKKRYNDMQILCFVLFIGKSLLLQKAEKDSHEWGCNKSKAVLNSTPSWRKRPLCPWCYALVLPLR